jgi:hypothetical protein
MSWFLCLELQILSFQMDQISPGRSTLDDIMAVKQLCRDFVTWLLAAHPEQREKILIYFEPAKWEQTLAKLSEIHARPDGAMLLARLDGVPVGCIMYHKIDKVSPKSKGCS